MKYLIGLLILIIGSSNCLASTTYTKEVEFGATSMSYGQLADLVEKVRTVLKDSNKKEACESASESMTIESRSIKVDLEKGFTKQNLLDGPSNAISIRYWLDYEGECELNKVSIYLTDSFRKLEVSGLSKEHLNTIAAVVANHMEEIGSTYGGSQQRLFGGMILLVFAAFIPLLAQILKVPKRIMPVAWVLMVLLYILLYVPSWENILPGTLITISEDDFFSRNSSAISVAGLAIGLLGLVISIYFGLKSSNSTEPTDT